MQYIQWPDTQKKQKLKQNMNKYAIKSPIEKINVDIDKHLV